MKIRNRITLIVLTFAICLSAFPICSFAETSDTANTEFGIVSATIGEPKISIESVIQNKVTKEIIEERYSWAMEGKPENYIFDPSIYLIEYSVSTDYWDRVSSMDYKGLTEAIDYSYPTIYIPFFGDIPDSKGDIHNRVIGYIKLSYDAIKQDYRLSSAWYNLTSTNYKDKIIVGFYEKIADYLLRSQTVAQQVFLIRYPSSLSNEMEKIAIIQTAEDTIILDISNSLHLETAEGKDEQSLAYTISNYRSLRKNIEKELYQSVNEWENNPSEGNAGLSQGKIHPFVYIWFILIPIMLLSIGVVILFLCKKHRKSHSK